MNALTYIWKKILVPACVIFTAVAFAVTAAAAAGGIVEYALSPSALGCILFFSVVISALNRVLFIQPLNFFLRLLIHYIGFVAAFFLTFFVILSGSSNARGGLLIIALLSILHFIADAVALIIRHSRIKKADSEKEYQRKF